MRDVAVFSKTFPSGDSLWPERMLLCLAVLLSYASVWPNEFVFDDKLLIVLNQFLKHGSLNSAGYGEAIGNFRRPIQMLIYFFIYQAFGLSTVAFHALNISLHALNACLLHHFGIRAGFRRGAAFAAALLWAVHPLNTIDVAYMASTAELLWSSFCLLGLIALLPDFSPRRSGAKQILGAFAPQKIWKATVFFILALGCKESAVVFPALAAITFFLVSKDRMQIAAYVRTWPFWLIAACYIAAWVWVIHQSGYSMDVSEDPVYFKDYTSNLTNRVLTSLATLPVYARLIIWPAGLHAAPVFPVFSTLLAWQTAAGALMVGLCLLQILRRGGLALSFGLLWCATALSPYTGIVFPIDAMISEGWMYMPAMGLFLGIAQTAAVFFEKRQGAARLLVLALALSLATTTFFQNMVWRNIETLYQNVLQRGGSIEHLSDYLGLFYMEHQQFDKAVEVLQYEIDHPDGRAKILWADTHFKLALAWLQVSVDENDKTSPFALTRALPSCKHIPEAIGELEKTLQDDPDFYLAHMVLSKIYRYQGDNQMADFHFKQLTAILRKQGGQGTTP